MEIAINKAMKQRIDYIEKLMIQIYLDGNRLNLSAHSWPSRYIAAEASNVYNAHNQSEKMLPDHLNL